MRGGGCVGCKHANLNILCLKYRSVSPQRAVTSTLRRKKPPEVRSGSRWTSPWTTSNSSKSATPPPQTSSPRWDFAKIKSTRFENYILICITCTNQPTHICSITKERPTSSWWLLLVQSSNRPRPTSTRF